MSTTLEAALVLTHLAATFYMVGLIWFVQRVHYPLFAGVGRERFRAYEQLHVSRTSPVVGPPMLIEAGTGVALLASASTLVPLGVAWIGIVLLGAVWLSTIWLQVPRHRELADGFDARAHRSLVATNWIRTVCWTLRGALFAGVVLQALVRSA
jgi:hypothetical protein